MSFLNIRQKIDQLRIKYVRKEFDGSLDHIPDEYMLNFCSFSFGLEYLYLLNSFLPQKRNQKLKILIVGVFGGRDYWGLECQGHEVTGFDISSIKNMPNIIHGNAEKKWPFNKSSFDVVIIGEVLEHLINDSFALSEANKVLNNNGKLIITVPYLDDNPVYHIRIHTKKTIERLLKINKFEIQIYIERPGIFLKDLLNKILNTFILISIFSLKKSFYRPISKFLVKLDFFMGRNFFLLRKVLYILGVKKYGGFFVCKKSNNSLLYLDENIKAFSK
jgi:SAM-dependent methyltransferase